MDAAAEMGRNPVSKHQIRPNRSRETNFSGADGDREIFIFPVQLTKSRIGNLTRLIHGSTLLYVMTIHTYLRYTRLYIILYIYITPRVDILSARKPPKTNRRHTLESRTQRAYSLVLEHSYYNIILQCNVTNNT